MSARRNRTTSFGAFLLSMFNALSCAIVICLDDSSGGPCTFVREGDGDVLGSAVSVPPMLVSSCAVALPVGRLADRNRFLTIIFQTR